MTDAEILIDARDRFKRCSEAEDPQRKIILQCKEFRSGKQWPDDIKIQRQGGAALQGQAAQPPRPMLTIDRISQPTRQVSNSVKQANFAINVQPNGYGADDETAKIYKGLLRWIQNRARAEAPIDWAADQAAEGGLGWFRIYAEYAEQELTPNSHPKDQDLCLGRIANNLSVYCDPASLKPTRSDAKFMFVTETVPKDEFKRLWPKADPTTLDEFRGTGDNNDWVTEDGYRVAEYWWITYDKTVLVELAESGQILPKKDAPEGAARTDWTRTLFTPKVECCKITATEILERWEWPGTRIPLFPIIGEELNIDGQPRYRGVIEPAMDPQRMVNYTYSGAIEISALGSKAPYIVAEGQIERYKDIWQNANRFNYSYLPYTPITLLGAAVGPPQRDTAEPPIQAMVLLLQHSEEAIKATTGIYDPTLGRSTSSHESGVKAKALIRQSEMGSSNYIDNVILTLTEAGDELVHLLPKYYDRAGRIVQILGIDDQPEQVMLNQPFQQTPRGPQASPVSPEQAALSQGLHQFYQMGNGRYSVTVSVGKSTTTQRQEGAQVIGEMLTANPQLLPLVGDIFFRDLDFPGSQEISERMKLMQPPQLQQSKDGTPNPAQLQAQLQQATHVMQALTQQNTAMHEAIQTDQIKAQQALELAKVKESAQTTRDLQQQATDVYLAKMKIVADLLKTQATIDAAEADRRISVATAQLDAQMAHEGQAQAQAHDAGLAAMAQQHALDAQDQAHQHAMMQQTAAPAPASGPEGGNP